MIVKGPIKVQLYYDNVPLTITLKDVDIAPADDSVGIFHDTVEGYTVTKVQGIRLPKSEMALLISYFESDDSAIDAIGNAALEVLSEMDMSAEAKRYEIYKARLKRTHGRKWKQHDQWDHN